MELLEIILREFTPRNGCGPWEPGWDWAYGLANYVIFQSYFLIAAFLALGLLQKKISGETSRQEMWLSSNHAKVIWSYAAFILFCGFGHLIDGVLSFFSARYHLWAIWHWLTALVSAYSCYVTFKIRKVAANLLI